MERGQRRNRVPECDLTREDYVAEIAVGRPQVTENQHLRNIIGSATYYRQSRIYAREGVELERTTLAGWVGKATALLEPLADAVGRHVLAGRALFADDTPVKVLAPGTGKAVTGRAGTYVRDERPWAGEGAPAAWYRFSPDRKAHHPKEHLTGFAGWMHADVVSVNYFCR